MASDPTEFLDLLDAIRGTAVPKPELGTKRNCPSCAARFYDLNHEPIQCPKCGETFEPEVLLKPRRQRAPKAEEVKPEAAEDEDDEEDEDAKAKATDDDDEDDEAVEIEELDLEKAEIAVESDDDDDDDDEDEPTNGKKTTDKPIEDDLTEVSEDDEDILDDEDDDDGDVLLEALDDDDDDGLIDLGKDDKDDAK